ncbi:MAG: DUF2752 domain-containing protein [Phycisphaerales bacterium]|nr:DUF2752 domain-containing protein [Phycisphaerales bacterium]
MANESAQTLSPAGRAVAAATAIAAATPLVVAAELTPSPDGIGTHTALGLPACGWQASMDLPCPSCGMTTAFAHTVRGDFLAAMTAQPAGMLVCLATAMLAVAAAYATLTGAPLQRLAGPLFGYKVLWVGIVTLIASWGFKIAQAGGLL